MTEPSDVVRRVPDADLGAIFGNRTEGLTGLAPRRPRPAPPVEAAPAADDLPVLDDTEHTPTAEPAQPATRTDKDSAPAAPRERRGGGARTTTEEAKPTRRRPARTTTSAANSPVPRLVILQLPNGIADQLRDQARARGVTYKELTLDAVESTADQLPDLLAAHRPQARTSGLFAGERVATQARPEGRRQVSIKLTESSINALDELADRYGARSRSELVATALGAYLGD